MGAGESPTAGVPAGAALRCARPRRAEAWRSNSLLLPEWPCAFDYVDDHLVKIACANAVSADYRGALPPDAHLTSTTRAQEKVEAMPVAHGLYAGKELLSTDGPPGLYPRAVRCAPRLLSDPG